MNFISVLLSSFTAPSSPPSNISALAENSTSISVSWGEVLAINQNGIITQYEVVYEPLETFMKQTVSRISIIVNTTLETLLLNLDEYVEYNITVRAYTFVGEGPFSFAITVRTLEDGKFPFSASLYNNNHYYNNLPYHFPSSTI